MNQAAYMNNKADCQYHTGTGSDTVGGIPCIETFLDNNGYTAREVRAIARHAITQWVQQRMK